MHGHTHVTWSAVQHVPRLSNVWSVLHIIIMDSQVLKYWVPTSCNESHLLMLDTLGYIRAWGVFDPSYLSSLYTAGECCHTVCSVCSCCNCCSLVWTVSSGTWSVCQTPDRGCVFVGVLRPVFVSWWAVTALEGWGYCCSFYAWPYSQKQQHTLSFFRFVIVNL